MPSIVANYRSLRAQPRNASKKYRSNMRSSGRVSILPRCTCSLPTLGFSLWVMLCSELWPHFQPSSAVLIDSLTHSRTPGCVKSSRTKLCVKRRRNRWAKFWQSCSIAARPVNASWQKSPRQPSRSNTGPTTSALNRASDRRTRPRTAPHPHPPVLLASHAIGNDRVVAGEPPRLGEVVCVQAELTQHRPYIRKERERGCALIGHARFVLPQRTGLVVEHVPVFFPRTAPMVDEHCLARQILVRQERRTKLDRMDNRRDIAAVVVDHQVVDHQLEDMWFCRQRKA
jgi:hypothetical protein